MDNYRDVPVFQGSGEYGLSFFFIIGEAKELLLGFILPQDMGLDTADALL